MKVRNKILYTIKGFKGWKRNKKEILLSFLSSNLVVYRHCLQTFLKSDFLLSYNNTTATTDHYNNSGKVAHACFSFFFFLI